MSLAKCIKKAGKALDKKDIDAIQARVDSGVSEIDAVTEHLASLDTELGGIAGRAEELGAKVLYQGQTPDDITETDEFKNWSGGGEVIESEDIHTHTFKPDTPTVLKVYHGTTHKFSVFDALQGNLEGQFGAINYFTSSEHDAAVNYAGEGPDLTSRIESRAEQLEQELTDYDPDDIAELAKTHDLSFDPESETYPEDLPQTLAREELSGGEDQTMELFVRVDNPFVIDQLTPQWIDLTGGEDVYNEALQIVADNNGVSVDEVTENSDDYDSEIDEARWELELEVPNILAEAISTVSNRHDVDAATLSSEVYDLGSETRAQDIEQLLRHSEDYQYAEGTEGELIGSQLVAEVIEEMGFDAIILNNADARFSNMGMELGTTHVHIFDSNKSNIKSAENQGTFDPRNPDIYMQDTDKPARGSISITTKEHLIRLGESSDTSTFLHETGHLFLNMEAKFSEEFGVTENQQALLDWLEVDSFADIQTEQHEKFARGFEAYLYEGKAPSPKLQAAFAQFSRWLKSVYRSITNLNVDLDDNIRQVFDRLLASEAEIEAVRANPAYDQFFRSQEQAGMTDTQWAAYLKQQEKAANRSQLTLDEQVLKELRERRTREWEDEKEILKAEERERIEQLPVYQIRQQLKDNKFDREQLRAALGIEPKKTAADRDKVDTSVDSLLIMAAKRGGLDMSLWSGEGVDPEYMKDRKFNNQVFGKPIFRKNSGLTPDDLAELANQDNYGGTSLSANEVLDLVMRELGGDPVYTPEGIEYAAERAMLEEQGIDPSAKDPLEGFVNRISKAGGEDPQVVAEVNGYSSVAHMARDLQTAPPINLAANAAAENRMLERHGDMLNDGSIEAEALDAVHNDEQAKLLVQELKALKKKANSTRKIDSHYIKNAAAAHIKTLKYKEIKPNRFYRAEIKAAQRAVSAKTDAERLEAKTQQLVNHHLYRMAKDARDAMQDQRRYVRKVQTRKYNTNDVAPEYVQNLKTLAGMYELRQNSERVLAADTIVNWYNAQVMDPNQFVKPELLDLNIIAAIDAKQRGGEIAENFKIPGFDELTADQLQGTYDMLRHLRFLGGQLSKNAKAETMKKREDLTESIIENGGKNVSGTRGIKRPGEKVRRYTNHIINKLPSLRNLIRKLDGMSEDGMAYDLIFRDVEKGNARKLELANTMYTRFETELDGLHKVGLSSYDKVNYKLENGTSLDLDSEARFMMAMYWGTETSREAVRVGFGVTDNDVANILSDMTKDQIELLNAAWKVNESLWPDLSESSVQMYGVAPPKLDPTPFEINGITLTGGHQRLFYDSTELDLKTEAEESIALKSVMPTKAGSLHARVGSGGRPPLLDVNNIGRAMDDSIHFIAFSEAGRNLKPLVSSASVRTAMETKHGTGFYTATIEAIEGITTNHAHREAIPALAAMMRLLRKAATFKHLAYSLRNTVQQASSIPIALQEVGMGSFVSSVARFATPANTSDFKAFVNERSQFMSNRASLVNREAAEFIRDVSAKSPAGHMWHKFGKYGFAPQTFIDSLIAYPTWMAKYEQALELHGDETKAASAADTAVAESVGSGSDLHLGGAFQSNNSEFVKTFTLFGSWFNAYFQRVYKSTDGLTTVANSEAFKTLVTTPLVVAVVSAAVIMDGPEDDEEFYQWVLKQYGYFMGGTVPILRDVLSSFKGFKPTSVYTSGGSAPAEFIREMVQLSEDKQTGLEAATDITKVVTNVVPVPGIGNLTRLMDYMDSYGQGKEGEFNIYQGLVEGPDRNK